MCVHVHVGVLVYSCVGVWMDGRTTEREPERESVSHCLFVRAVEMRIKAGKNSNEKKIIKKCYLDFLRDFHHTSIIR